MLVPRLQEPGFCELSRASLQPFLPPELPQGGVLAPGQCPQGVRVGSGRNAWGTFLGTEASAFLRQRPGPAGGKESVLERCRGPA